jgi:hypothetical protein
MASVSIVKIKVRRGTDAERQLIVLDNGELGFTIDQKRLFIGDGVTTGGLPTSIDFVFADINNNFTYQNALLNDVVIDNNSSVAYVVSGIDTSNPPPYNYFFRQIGPLPDELLITFNGSKKLTLKNNSVNENYIQTTSFTGGISGGGGQKIRVNYDNNKITLVGGQLTVSESSLNMSLLNASTLPTANPGPNLLWKDIAAGNVVKVGT